MTLQLSYGEAVALAALLSLSRTPLAARLVARLDAALTLCRLERADTPNEMEVDYDAR